MINLNEYITDQIIGTNSVQVPCETWEQMKVKALQTKNDYFYYLEEWYNVSTCPLEVPSTVITTSSNCYSEITDLWAEYQSFLVDFDIIWETFWTSLSCTGEFNVAICDAYRRAMVDLKCFVKRMMTLFDGDFQL